MSVKDNDILKGYFIKGAYPVESNFQDLIDSTSNQLIKRELMFYDNQEIIIKHSQAETINSEDLSSEITAIEYSLNGGGFADPSYPITIAANDKTKWRVKTYNAALIIT
jgi:hypothetical protein